MQKPSTVFSLFMHQVPLFFSPTSPFCHFLLLPLCFFFSRHHCFSPYSAFPALFFFSSPLFISPPFYFVVVFFTSLTCISSQFTSLSLSSFAPPVARRIENAHNRAGHARRKRSKRTLCNPCTCWASGNEEEKQTAPLLHHRFLKCQLPFSSSLIFKNLVFLTVGSLTISSLK